MRIAKYSFRPRLIPSALTVLLLPVLIGLGFWQLSRMEQKQLEQASRVEKMSLPPLELTGSDQVQRDVEFRQVSVHGRFDSRYTIYIDNKVHNGQVGYQIVMPLQLAGTDEAILVNRGWIKAAQTRDVLPGVPPTPGEVKVTGMAKVATKDVASLGLANRAGDSWPALVRWVDIQELQADIPYKLMPFVLLETSGTNDGLLREWRFSGSPPEKNLSYAVQWFSLAAALLIIYVVVNTHRIKRSGLENE